MTDGGISVVQDGLTVAGGLSAVGGAVISWGLTVYGDLAVSSTITTFTSSDRRLKRDIMPISDALSKVNKLNGVYFKWIQDEPNGLLFDTERHVGVIAQEVLHVLPEVVTNIHDDKYLGVDYAAMMPLIIEAVRELDENFKNENVTDRNAAEVLSQLRLVFSYLQTEMEALTAKNVMLEAKKVAMKARNAMLQEKLNRMKETVFTRVEALERAVLAKQQAREKK